MVPYAPWKTVVAEFHRAFCFSLVGKGASPEIVYAFEDWGKSVAIQKSLEKPMLETHNDLSSQAAVHLNYGDDLAHTNRSVQGCPLSVLPGHFPDTTRSAKLASGPSRSCRVQVTANGFESTYAHSCDGAGVPGRGSVGSYR